MKRVFAFIKLIRPHHYIKNLLIFLPIIFSKNILNITLLNNTIIGTIAFSLMASIVYIINDIMDVEADRKHEKKKLRPIACGDVSIKSACLIATILFVISVGLNLYIIRANRIANILFFGYLFMNILYSIKLKHIPIVDIVILALGFLIRVLYGAAITGIEISNWLYLTILSLSFYMGLGKRKNEFKKMGNKGRKVLHYYNQAFLDSNMYICMALAIVFYSLWCIGISTNMVWTVPFVIVICMKYSLNIEGDSLGDPVDVILGDKVLFLLAFVYAIIMLGAIYF